MRATLTSATWAACGILFLASGPASAGDTPGKVEVTFTTETYGGVFAPDSFVAAWVVDASGNFVKTLLVRCTQPFGGRLNHLVAWTADSGQDYTDAVTGATVMQHETRTVEWDCTDASGTLVADSFYSVRLEFTENNSNGAGQDGPNTPTPYLMFFKSGSSVSTNIPDQIYFKDVSLTFTPNTPVADAGTDITVTDSDGTGAETIALDGSGSSDPDGTIARYRWLEGDTELATGVTANVELSVNSHTITLEVTDNDGKTDTDTLTVLVRPADYDPDLVAHFKFDAAGTPVDSTGNGLDGSYLNGASWTASGRIGGGAQCDGTDDLVSIPNSDLINTGTHGQRSVTAWFLATDPSVNARKQTIYEEGGSARGLAIYLFDARLYVGGWNAQSGESNWSGTYLSTTNVTAGQWHHVALVLDGGATTTPEAFSAYLDGEMIATGDGSQLWAHSDAIGVGGLNGGTLLHDGTTSGTHGFAGRIDDGRIYNRALSADDIGWRARNDLDHDSLPDDWERAVSEATTMRPHDDDDGDGRSNLAEYRADTHPANAASVLRLTGIERHGSSLRLAWQGGTDAQQRVEYMDGDAPAPTGWTPLVTFDPPTPATTNTLLAPPPSRTRFYRIRAMRP